MRAENVTRTGVYYLKNMPEINALEEDVRPGYGSFVFVTLGATLVYIINNRKREKGDYDLSPDKS